MLRDYTYIDNSLFPVYINNEQLSNLQHQDVVGVQRYNSPLWMSYLNNQELDNLHTLVKLSDEDEEDPSNNYYQNFQLITDLFDIILTKQSEFRNKKIHYSVDYMLRQKEYPVDLSSDSRYIARFSIFHLQNNAIILLANPTSNLSKQLINKRQRLNEYL